MHNPDQVLPSGAQLVKATLLALITALVLLLTVVMPAEYGLDPTGAGKILGLTKMGQIKQQLAQEAQQENTPPVQAAENHSLPVASQPAKDTVEGDMQSDELTITLKADEAAEIKVSLKKDQLVHYHWQVDRGHVNFDNHADNAQTKYHGYSKGKAKQQDEGSIVAAFDGKHGWFWRNRSGKTVTITLKISGDYTAIHRVL